MKDSVLFLYCQIPDYFLNCIEEFVHTNNTTALVLVTSANKKSPYKLNTSDRVKIIYQNELTQSQINELYIEEAFSAVYGTSSVWTNREFRKILSFHMGKIPTILGVDNIWLSNFRQVIGSLISPWFLKSIYSHIWIPGRAQHEFALKMGYSDDKIIQNLYSANINRFNKDTGLVPKVFNRRIVYAGRLIKYKRPDWLLSAYLKLSKNVRDNWKLEFIGEGELLGHIEKEKCPGVTCHKFMQPQDLANHLRSGGIFCLPSINEHWGVSIHEATCSAMPLLISDSCGAGKDLLINKFNGLSFSTYSFEDFFSNLEKMTSMNDSELFLMSQNSYELSKKISPKIWAATVCSIL